MSSTSGSESSDKAPDTLFKNVPLGFILTKNLPSNSGNALFLLLKTVALKLLEVIVISPLLSTGEVSPVNQASSGFIFCNKIISYTE